MTTRETEIKIDLFSRENYRKLLDSLKGQQTTIYQENYFFDTPRMSLAAAGWALRIRLKSGRAIITAKGPRADSTSGIACRPETEVAIEPDMVARFIKDGLIPTDLPTDIRKALPSPEKEERLIMRLKFSTTRTAIKQRLGNQTVIFEIDHTHFADDSDDFELEVEIDDGFPAERIKDELERTLQTMGIPFKYQNRDKIARASEKANLKPG